MNQDTNYARYNPNILGPSESLQYVQGKLEKLENRRVKAIELIKLRKQSIVKASDAANAQLDRNEAVQRRLPLVGKIVFTGAVFVAAIELAKSGWTLCRSLVSRQRAKRRNTEGGTDIQDQRYGEQETYSPQRPGKRSLSRRMHTRDWLVDDLL
jgi:hypothetical protein